MCLRDGVVAGRFPGTFPELSQIVQRRRIMRLAPRKNGDPWGPCAGLDTASASAAGGQLKGKDT